VIADESLRSRNARAFNAAGDAMRAENEPLRYCFVVVSILGVRNESYVVPLVDELLAGFDRATAQLRRRSTVVLAEISNVSTAAHVKKHSMSRYDLGDFVRIERRFRPSARPKQAAVLMTIVRRDHTWALELCLNTSAEYIVFVSDATVIDHEVITSHRS
jgi:hypothetical protein